LHDFFRIDASSARAIQFLTINGSDEIVYLDLGIVNVGIVIEFDGFTSGWIGGVYWSIEHSYNRPQHDCKLGLCLLQIWDGLRSVSSRLAEVSIRSTKDNFRRS
jgi:hypothetical protein